MALITQKELKKRKKDLKIDDEIVTVKEEKIEVVIQSDGRKWSLSCAPQGESKAFFYHNGNECSIRLVDGIHEIPDHVVGHELIEYMSMLSSAGLVVCAVTNTVTAAPQEMPKIAVFMHSDYSEDEEFFEEFEFKFKDGNEEKIIIGENGIIKTDNQAAKDALIEAGYTFIRERDKINPNEEE